MATSNEILDSITGILGRSPFTGPQREETVASLEATLQTHLPASFRTFLMSHGGGYGLSGLYGNQPELRNPGTVFGDTLRMRERHKLPEQYIVVFVSPLGGIYCLDASSISESRECSVVQFAFGPGDRLTHRQVVASSFEAYLCEYLEARLQVLVDELGTA